ncbi:MAG: hypothetical protein ACRD2E_06120 [Terriglobales bacterium]
MSVRFQSPQSFAALALGLAMAVLAPAAQAQGRQTPVAMTLAPAAVLQVANVNGTTANSGQAITAAPGGASLVTLSYRASRAGGAALTVAAAPGASSPAGILLSLSGPAPRLGAFTAGQQLVSSAAGPVVLWRGGPEAHGLGQSFLVRYAAAAGQAQSQNVVLVYTLAVS